MHKGTYWEHTYEDVLDVVAKLPEIAAIIYRCQCVDARAYVFECACSRVHARVCASRFFGESITRGSCTRGRARHQALARVHNHFGEQRCRRRSISTFSTLQLPPPIRILMTPSR